MEAMNQFWLKLKYWFWSRRNCEKFTTTTKPASQTTTDKGVTLLRNSQLSFWSRGAKNGL